MRGLFSLRTHVFALGLFATVAPRNLFGASVSIRRAHFLAWSRQPPLRGGMSESDKDKNEGGKQ